MRRFILGGVALTALAIAIPARAGLTQINTNPSPDGNGATLYVGVGGASSSNGPTIMDTLYGAGNYVRIDDTGGFNDQVWGYLTNPPTANISAEVRFAGHSSDFGVFTSLNSNSSGDFIRLATVSGTGYSASFTNPNGTYTTSGPGSSINIVGTLPSPPGIVAPFALGFNDTTANTYYSSVQGANATTDPYQNDHIITFWVTGGQFAGSLVVAYEDLTKKTGADYDYNDAVIQINGLTPVPEPSTMAIAGLGALGFGARAWRRRVQKSKKS